MFKNLLALLLTLLSVSAYAGAPYPSLVIKNQFGETAINSVVGGSNEINLSFKVNHIDSAGKGITNLVQNGYPSNGVVSVFMNTTATPAAGSPNPAPGVIMVQLASNYASFVAGLWGAASPLSGMTPVSIATASNFTVFAPYVITTVGTTQSSNWVLMGMAPGVSPSPGVPFVVPSPAPTVFGTGFASTPGVSGISDIEFIGNPSADVAATGGAVFIMQALSSVSNIMTPTAPTDGTTISLRFTMNALPSQLK